jgi:hypothetical protein
VVHDETKESVEESEIDLLVDLAELSLDEDVPTIHHRQHKSSSPQ